MHAVEFFLKNQSSSVLSERSLSLMTQEYSSTLFKTANHWSLSGVKKWHSKIST